MNDCLALTDELKLREDNSDMIDIHPKLNCDFSLRSYVRVFACSQSKFSQTRMHLLSSWYSNGLVDSVKGLGSRFPGWIPRSGKRFYHSQRTHRFQVATIKTGGPVIVMETPTLYST